MVIAVLLKSTLLISVSLYYTMNINIVIDSINRFSALKNSFEFNSNYKCKRQRQRLISVISYIVTIVVVVF